MKMPKPFEKTGPFETGNPIVVTEAKTLSRAAGEIEAFARDHRLGKNTILNILARAVCGPDRNWGYLKGRDHIVQDSRVEARFGDNPAIAAEIAKDATSNQLEPLYFEDLSDEWVFRVNETLLSTPEFYPLLQVLPRPDGGLSFRGYSWGARTAPVDELQLVCFSFAMTPLQVADLAEDWRDPDQIPRRMWEFGAIGYVLSLEDEFGEFSAYLPGGAKAVLLKDQFFGMVKLQYKGPEVRRALRKAAQKAGRAA